MKHVVIVLGYVKHIRNKLIALVTLSVVMAALGAVQPYAFKVIVDQIVANVSSHTRDATPIIIALAALVAIRLINIVLSYFITLFGNRTYYSIITDLRDAIFRRLTTLSIDYFEKTKAGEIMQRANSNVSEIANWFYNAANNFLGQILTVLFALGLITYVDPLAGAVMLVAIAAYFFQQLPALRQTRPIGKASRKAAERAGGYLQETIAHISTVRSFGGENGAIAAHNQALNEYAELSMQRQQILQRSIASRQITNAIAVVIVLGIISYGALQGKHSAGDILLIALYMQQITGNLWSLGRFMLDSNEVDITAERVVEMLQTKPTVVDSKDAIELDGIHIVEFKNVSFKYPGKRRLILDNASFKIHAGQSFALIGPSGTGKTTVTKLLMRYYDATDGQILINDQPINNYTQESLRRHLGVVMQDVALFNDTIQENLKLAHPEAKLAEIKAAAQEAHADVFIEKLSDGYKTVVGERGVKLSGGEKQRIAIARAILKQPEMVILDEATSALDSESEQQVQAGLGRLLSGRGAIVIAHRLSTIMAADQILVMDKGTIKERGSHEELVNKKGGTYAKLFKLQSGGFIKLK